ncbi:MAG TPA: hypothetical protein VGS57_22770 [Thermoanaerobaculia bacterium]|jgi:hypothetical protein|nr:hypothetical protein [Thermoanaerobaculia bacterium]
MGDEKVEIGQIRWIDDRLQNGVIARLGGGEVYFERDKVDGIPRVGLTVQFVPEPRTTDLGIVAKKVIVLADAAARAQRRA